MSRMEFVAHRAGNHPDSLRLAEGRVDAIELDAHRGPNATTEIRHAKRLWPTRRLWDRWFLVPKGQEFPLVDDILDAARTDTSLWFDLKGPTTNLTEQLLAMAAQGERRLVVSSKSWWLLRRFTGTPGIRTFWSAGNRFELGIMLAAPWLARSDGAVVHQRLLGDRVLPILAGRGPVFVWGAQDAATVASLERRGVDGVILDDLTLATRPPD